MSSEHNINEYEDRTYEDLSQEFMELYSAAARAFNLIPMMYNRLTLVEEMTHKEAVEKIYNDHHHLSGFTERNIRRYLPRDNPQIPRRIRSSRPKNSITETPERLELSTTEQSADGKVELVEVTQHREDDFAKRENEFEFDPEHQEQQNYDTVSAPQSSSSSSNKYDVVDFEIRLNWEYVHNYMYELYNSDNTQEVCFSGELDRRTGKVIAVYAGRKEDRNHF
jgi:hypothetical protein